MADTAQRKDANKTQTRASSGRNGVDRLPSATAKPSKKGNGSAVEKGEPDVNVCKKDINAVSKIVSQKLDLLLNNVKREQSFDPTGGRRVQSAGHCITSVIEWPDVDLHRQQEQHNRSHRERRVKSAMPVATPRHGSASPRRHSASDSAVRLNQYANSLLDSRAPSNLAAIRRFLSSHGSSDCYSPSINVQNFRIHFGNALTLDKYLDFYEQRGYCGGRGDRTNRNGNSNDSNRSGSGNNRLPGRDLRFSACEQRMLEDYLRRSRTGMASTPRYVESSWDVAASVRHQMRTFTVNEIRRLRQNSSESSGSGATPIRVCIEEDEFQDHQLNNRDQGNDGDIDEDEFEYPEEANMSLKHRYFAEMRSRRLQQTSDGAPAGFGTTAICDVSGIEPDNDADSDNSYGYED